MFDGSDFIELAGKLCVLRGADEAGFRTAASRAYYGAFHLANEFLDDLNCPVPANENAHGHLRLQLMNAGQPDAVSAGSILRELHRIRIRADYSLADDKFRESSLARLVVERAHEFRRLIDLCRSEPARSQIQTGIADYQSRLP